ncbi:N-acetylmuramoyl-L-alanine amidase [Thermodesulfobacteriota bacterium]
MMRSRTSHIAIFLIIILVMFAGLSLVPEESYGAVPKAKTLIKKADQCRDSLYRSSKRMKYRHNWLNCIDRYENIFMKYPGSDQAPWAMYRSAMMFTKLYKYSGLEDDLDKAVETFERVAAQYKDHRLADDAQYKIGDIFYNFKKDPTQAYVEFLKVDIKFPSGDMRPKAREMMDKLTVILGKKERNGAVEKGPSSDNGLTAVKNIRHWSTPTYTRVVIDLERQVEYKSHLLDKDPTFKKPRRLYLDLEKTYVGSDIESTIPIKDGLLQRARAGQYKEDTVRVVLDIESIGDHKPKIFPLHDPFRIVVDVRGDEKKTIKKKTISKTVTRSARGGIRRVKKPDKSVSLARQLGLSVKRIVIDPGHGGRDPGCYHAGGIREKNIVLNLAKKLAKRIKEKLGCEVLLTRTSDKSVPLDERTAFANVKKADLFISLHVNAHKQKNIFGVETYFLNMATDKRAVMVAARENATSEKNISDLQSILNDLMLNTKISESSKLAYQVQKGMMNNVREKYRTNKSLGVKQAPFYVLIGAEMPSILVETGFITNATERNRLLSEKYRTILADGIVAGVNSYIKSIDQVYKGG